MKHQATQWYSVVCLRTAVHPFFLIIQSMGHRGCTPFCEKNALPWRSNLPEVGKKERGKAWQVRRHWQTCLLFIFFSTPQVLCVSHTIACKVTVLPSPLHTAAMDPKCQFLCESALPRVFTLGNVEGKSLGPSSGRGICLHIGCYFGA